MTGSASAPELRLDGVSFGFDGRLLLDRFGFVAPAGQWTCLLGPSGCGKSTLLRLISGSLAPAAGRIAFDGQDRSSGLVAWMAQKDLLLPWLNVTDNVLLGARLRGRVTADRRVRAAELLRAAGLADYAAAAPAELSGGMRQRVALLRTLMEDRPVILMDEPFSALDALTRLKLQTLAAELVRGATVVLVTHDPWEALRLGHNVQVIRGRPARLSPIFSPPGAPPREPTGPRIGEIYARLMDQLKEDQ